MPAYRHEAEEVLNAFLETPIGEDCRSLTPAQALEHVPAIRQRSAGGTGITPAELAALSGAGRDALKEKASAALNRHRPHYIIDTVADLPAVIEEIEARMARGERP